MEAKSDNRWKDGGYEFRRERDHESRVWGSVYTAEGV